MSSGGATVGTFLMIAVIAVSLIVIYEFGYMATASSDIGVNLTGTSYQHAYNQSGNTSRVAFETFSYLPLLGTIGAVAFGLLLLLAFLPKR